jgi:hypothetical protein
MPGKIVVVAVNIPANWKQYNELNGDQKAEFFSHHISVLCEEELMVSDPNATWIVVLREYAISESPTERAITSRTKKILKDKMAALVEKYPNLRIIAGTVATRSHKSVGKAKEHFQLYSNKRIMQLIEEDQKEKEPEFPNYISQFKKILDKNQDQKLDEKPIQMMRNTCYIFSPEGVQRRDKNAPFQELRYDKNVDDLTAYRVGKENKSMSPFITIQDLKGEDIALGIEICREHTFGFLKQYDKEKKATFPIIHFILSDILKLDANYFFGSYVIQLDTQFSPKLITPDPSLISKALPEVVLYSSDLWVKQLKKHRTMLVPIEPLYPFQCKILKVFDECLSKWSDRNPRKRYLKQEREIFCNTAMFGYDQEIVNYLEALFQLKEVYFINSKEDKLSYAELPLKTQGHLCFILHNKKIYYVDHTKKTFVQMDDKFKIHFERYFKKPITCEQNKKAIIEIELLTGYKTNKMLELLNERYWLSSNPIILFRNHIHDLVDQHKKELKDLVKDVYRKSDLAVEHPFIQLGGIEADLQLDQKEMKEKTFPESPPSAASSQSDSNAPFSKSPSSEGSEPLSEVASEAASEASNDQEFLEKESMQRGKRTSSS